MQKSLLISLFFLVVALSIVPAAAVDPVSDLKLVEKGMYHLKWTWTDPSVNYTTTEVWLDGKHVTNTTAGEYTAKDLEPDSTHTISLRVWSDAELAYSTWVNHTATTYSLWGFLGEEIIGGIVNVIPSIGTLVIAIVPIILLLIVVGFIVGLMDSIIGAVKDAFRFLRR
jgi:hypothetical protein